MKKVLLSLLIFSFLTVLAQDQIGQITQYNLPQEVKMIIFANLSSAKTLDEAVKNIKAALLVNKEWNALLSDPLFTKQLIQDLTQKFPQETQNNPLITALNLGTDAAMVWVNSQGFEKNKELASALLKKYSEQNLDNPKFTQIELQALSMLIDKNPEIAKIALGFVGDEGISSLGLSVRAGDTQLVELLLNKGADVNEKMNVSMGIFPPTLVRRTPIMFVIEPRDENLGIKVAELLLKKGANPNIPNQIGETILMIAVQMKKNKLTQFLLENKADPNIQDKNGDTALILSAKNNDIELVKLLLNKKADPNVVNKRKITALQYAAFNNNIEMVRELLNAGANPNVQVLEKGYTALLLAASKNNKEMVQLLLEKGANPKAQSEKGLKAINATTDPEIQAMLKDAMSKPK